MRIPWPTQMHERLSAASTLAERRRFQDITEFVSFRKSDVRIAPGEFSVLLRRPAALRPVEFLGIRLGKVFGRELPVVPSKLTIRSVRSWRIRDEHPGDEIDVGGLSLRQVGKGLLHLGERHEVGERYGIEIDIDSLDVELEDIAQRGEPA